MYKWGSYLAQWVRFPDWSCSLESNAVDSLEEGLDDNVDVHVDYVLRLTADTDLLLLLVRVCIRGSILISLQV
jgi:hypothetical protein